MSTLVVSCNSTDCWANKNSNFGNSEDYLYIIDDPAVSNSNVRNWIPFTIPLRGSAVINTVYLTVTIYANSSAGGGTMTIGCEAADNPSAPIDAADLNGRTVTTFTASGSVGTNWTALDTFTWQMDNPFAEVIARSGWRPGNTLAVILYESGIGDGTRQIYSSRGAAGAYKAYLTIDYTDFIPRSGGLV